VKKDTRDGVDQPRECDARNRGREDRTWKVVVSEMQLSWCGVRRRIVRDAVEVVMHMHLEGCVRTWSPRDQIDKDY